jgi:hypothetical protein
MIWRPSDFCLVGAGATVRCPHPTVKPMRGLCAAQAGLERSSQPSRCQCLQREAMSAARMRRLTSFPNTRNRPRLTATPSGTWYRLTRSPPLVGNQRPGTRFIRVHGRVRGHSHPTIPPRTSALLDIASWDQPVEKMEANLVFPEKSDLAAFKAFEKQASTVSCNSIPMSPRPESCQAASAASCPKTDAAAQFASEGQNLVSGLIEGNQASVPVWPVCP